MAIGESLITMSRSCLSNCDFQISNFEVQSLVYSSSRNSFFLFFVFFFLIIFSIVFFSSELFFAFCSGYAKSLPNKFSKPHLWSLSIQGRNTIVEHKSAYVLRFWGFHLYEYLVTWCKSFQRSYNWAVGFAGTEMTTCTPTEKWGTTQCNAESNMHKIAVLFWREFVQGHRQTETINCSSVMTSWGLHVESITIHYS